MTMPKARIIASSDVPIMSRTRIGVNGKDAAGRTSARLWNSFRIVERSIAKTYVIAQLHVCATGASLH
ncbi:hypothetical protein A3D71_04390 [Candidatus Kaiserbacteria bacterium RIFCSPHIGHO2_02_FULL_55_20]|uniref:Uncharacterized protein n=1 Tax=Candidatus Kaiserbacteria bacterium RIFCSPHIGHO2_02_FULL_55_20 TaxID=1798497 RepID=A0A1F6DV22_9BACT|nr:MAG: hypothetical protein A3D71_04390 [Candidatus Kaiserbacteria bacterium RIFCSPHIGHO2_02_FULL_55_20]